MASAQDAPSTSAATAPVPAAVPQQTAGEGQAETILGSAAFPTRLSTILKITTSITPAGRQEFIRKSKELFAKRNKSNYEKEWLADYMEHQEELHSSADVGPLAFSSPAASQIGVPEVEYRHQEQASQAHFQSCDQLLNTEVVRPADLNRLFVKPEEFNGIKPPPRQWLDQYEKAAFSNGWTDTAKIKYMATFLKDTAYSWLTEIVPLHLPNGFTWFQLRALFIRCYMGESDRQAAKREFDKAIQRENEKAAQFIPRMVQMIKTLDPNRKQEIITDDIRHKLLPEYQEKLIMFELRTIQHLYDACTKIEAGMAASRAASRQRERAAKQLEPATRSRQLGRQDERPTRRSSPVPFSRSQRPSSPASDSDPGKSPRQPTKTDASNCFRCGRNNHWAKDCRANTHLDGSPCKDSPAKDKTVKFSKSVNLLTDDESSAAESGDEGSQSGEASDQTEEPRSAGRLYNCNVVSPNECNSQNIVSGGTLIKQQIRCNDETFLAIIDTGAFISTVDAQGVAENGWKLQETKQKLYHAVGEPMTCLGSVEL